MPKSSTRAIFLEGCKSFIEDAAAYEATATTSGFSQFPEIEGRAATYISFERKAYAHNARLSCLTRGRFVVVSSAFYAQKFQ